MLSLLQMFITVWSPLKPGYHHSLNRTLLKPGYHRPKQDVQ